MNAAPLLSALNPASAPIDGKSTRDRLAFVAQLSRLVRFYTLDNRVEGDWQRFLLKDPAILLATIAATDYHGLHAQYKALVQAHGAQPSDKEQSMTAPLLGLLRHMCATLDHWLHWMELQDEDFFLRRFLERAVREQLAPRLPHLRALHQTRVHEFRAHETQADAAELSWYASLSPIWHQTAPPPPWRQAESQGTASAMADELQQRYLDTLRVMVQTVEAAIGHYDQIAAEPTRHPDTALMRVFVQLMRHQQDKINQIGHRHLDFYYRELLQVEPRPAVPDQVVVMLSPVAGQDCVILPPGTAFAAGKDAQGKVLTYANPQSAAINSASIAAAFRLKSESGEAATPGFRPGLHADALADLEQPQLDPAGHMLDQAVFGAPLARPLGLGFALASPMLLLESGSRSLCITIEMSPETPLPPLPEDWASGWRCWLTSAKGWFEAGMYLLPPQWEPGDGDKPSHLTLELMLPSDAPPVVAADKPQDGRDCPWPQIKFALPPSATACPWPRVLALGIEARVRDLTGLQLWSDLAPLSGNAMMPLGPVPPLGGQFHIGSREMFAKPLTRLTLSLNWSNLPASIADWYKDYTLWQAETGSSLPAYSDTIHGGDWQHRQPDGWQPVSVGVPIGCQPKALFQSDGKSSFTFRFEAKAAPPAPALAQAPLPPPAEASAGYLRFTLDSPPQAFGHQQYAQLLVWSCQQQAAALIQPSTPPTTPLSTPNPPLTPLLSAVTADYSAACRLIPGADAGAPNPACPVQWLHYGPWENWLVWESGQRVDQRHPLAPGLPHTGLGLIPRLPAEGSLLLALSSLPAPCGLRLYAEVTEDGGGRGFEAWLYGDKGWQAVDVWQDETLGLSGAGIFELSLPETPAPLPLRPDLDNHAWLALTPKDGWRELKLSLLASQAVRLERQDLPADSPEVPPLAAGSIKKAPLPQLAKLRQPLASAGGRGAEGVQGYDGPGNYYQRVSRRLLHKGRILTERDIMLLAQEARPDLYRTAFLPVPADHRGEVWLGVVPQKPDSAAPGAFRPRLSPGELEALAEELQALGGDGLRLSVHNMAMCELTLSAQLILSDEAQAAWPLLRNDWNLALRLFLSPWIASDLPHYDPGHGLTRAALLRRLAAFPGVLSVGELTVRRSRTDGPPILCPEDHLLPPAGAIWVSAAEHDLILVED